MKTKRESRIGTLVYKFRPDPLRPGFVIVEISGLTEDEALNIIPGSAKH